MDTVGVMSERGRYRKYRVAVYAVCGSAYEVEIAFDRLIETMLSDRREDYFWGVMLDHAPSPLFRTFGDGEIEGRVRKRFDELCRDYPQCGFFCLLRGRRYAGNGGGECFKCEDGLYGAIKMLAGGKDEGFTLRLSTGDTVEHSDRVFIRDIRGGDGWDGIFPGDISRSSLMDGAVFLVSGVMGDARAKKRFLRGVFDENTENYRVIGWVKFPLNRSDQVNLYRLADITRSDTEKQIFRKIDIESAVECAERGFMCFDNRVDGGAPRPETDDGCAWEILVDISLAALGRIDAVNLQKRLTFRFACAREAIKAGKVSEAAFLRVILLACAAFCDTLGTCDEMFYTLATEARGIAELLRCEYELDGCEEIAYFMPCEMVAYRMRADYENSFFFRICRVETGVGLFFVSSSWLQK